MSDRFHKSLNTENEDRIMIFVDGPNFFHTQRAMGWKVQPSKIIEFFSKEDTVVEATYYVGVDEYDRARPFIKALQHMGFTVFEKPIRMVQDHRTREDKKRIDIDIEIVHDLLVRKEKFDTAVIVSGSRNFMRTMETLKNLGKNVVVLASQEFLSDAVKNIVGKNIYYLEDLQDQFEYYEREDEYEDEEEEVEA